MRYRESVIVPRAQTEGPLVSIEPDDAHRGDVGVRVYIDIEKYREGPDMST